VPDQGPATTFAKRLGDREKPAVHLDEFSDEARQSFAVKVGNGAIHLVFAILAPQLICPLVHFLHRCLVFTDERLQCVNFRINDRSLAQRGSWADSRVSWVIALLKANRSLPTSYRPA
jgi:hypothetical protein